jgi:hypothetical protein
MPRVCDICGKFVNGGYVDIVSGKTTSSRLYPLLKPQNHMLEPHVIEYNQNLLDRQSYKVPTITQEQLECFSTRFLMNQKPFGVSTMSPDSTIGIAAYNIPKKKKHLLDEGLYNVKVSDFMEVLNSRPHVPNKKEGKIFRRFRAKKGI